MVELIQKTPCVGMLPLTVGGASLNEAAPKCVTSIMPHKGKKTAVSKALKTAHGMALPADGRSTGRAVLRAIWAGQGQYLLTGNAACDAALSQHASLCDQSDGWAVIVLSGAAADDVMARLCPLDLRAEKFKRGHAARTELAHMMAMIVKTTGGFEIWVMRSFAKTAVGALQEAMENVAAEAKV